MAFLFSPVFGGVLRLPFVEKAKKICYIAKLKGVPKKKNLLQRNFSLFRIDMRRSSLAVQVWLFMFYRNFYIVS